LESKEFKRSVRFWLKGEGAGGFDVAAMRRSAKHNGGEEFMAVDRLNSFVQRRVAAQETLDRKRIGGARVDADEFDVNGNEERPAKGDLTRNIRAGFTFVRGMFWESSVSPARPRL
jgi:hypothetical protein